MKIPIAPAEKRTPKPNENILVGKNAVIDCLTEQLESIGIPVNKHVYPGKKVIIYKYDGEHSKYGSSYQVDDYSGCPPDFYFIIPLIWLNISDEN